jgi:hypothetical protein
MSKSKHTSLSSAIQKILFTEQNKPSNWLTKSIASPTLLTSLLLHSQPALPQPMKVETVPIAENPLTSPIPMSHNPTFADINNDGDLDVFIAADDQTIKYDENLGNPNQSGFVERTEQHNPFNGVSANKSPTFVDIDGDGDLDAFIGGKRHSIHFDGDKTKYITIKYYQNIGTVSQPMFANQAQNGLKLTNPLAGIKLDAKIQQITLIDVDSDNDLDALIGSAAGTVAYYENTGTASQPHFDQRFKPNNPFASVGIYFGAIRHFHSC